MTNLKLWVDDSPYIDEFLESVWDDLFEESIIDSARNALKKPKISGKTKFENQLNLTFKGIKISIDKNRSDANDEMFLKRVKRDLSWLNKAYDKTFNMVIEEYLLKIADNWEMPKSASKIKSLMKLDYAGYNPGPGENKCSFNVAYNSMYQNINKKFFDGHSFWIRLDFENGENYQNEWNIEG